MTGKPSSSQLAVYRLAGKFVERQEIVLHAMIELHPILMVRAGVIPQSQLSPTLTIHSKSSIVPVGDWGEGKEWHYLLHGAGCLLIHKITNEPINWDAPDTQRFDRYWFVDWVEWALKREDCSEATAVLKSVNSDHAAFKEFIFEMLDQLQILGRIVQSSSSNSNKYQFIAFPELQEE
jgi:hypothetical protein